MAATANLSNLNSAVIPFSLKGTDEKFYSPSDFNDKNILVIIFMCNHCPYVKGVMDKFVSLSAKFKDRGVQFIGINPNDASSYPQDSFENMKKFYEEYNMNFPYLADETQETARAYGAVCTPDIYVYDKSRILKYRGRINDNWKDDSKVTSNDLENAITLLLEGREIDFRQVPSMGCSIKWKQNN